MVATLPAGIPTVDIRHYRYGSAEARKDFVKAWGDGLQAFGFVTVEGHGVDPGAIRDIYDQVRRLFALPEAAKRAYEMPEGGERGYTAFGKEHAKDSQVPDLKEFWHVGQELPAGHRLAGVYPANFWPRELPEFQAKTMAVFRALEGVATTMLEALEDFLGLSRGQLAAMIVDGNSVMRAIHYPPLGPEAPEGAIRAAAHEDINLMTILAEATAGGLEILTHDGEWIGVEALQGQFVVDSGDMLSRITNLTIPATTHRVVNPPGDRNVARYSLPFFVHPCPDCELRVLDACTSAANPAKFPPILADAFLKQRLREIGLY